MTYSDIQNKAEYKASSTGIGYSWGNGPLKGKDGKDILVDGKPVDNPANGYSLNPGTSATGNADSTTKSAIALGTIEVRSNPNVDLSGLSRDPSGALNALGKIFDKKTVQEQQELAKVFGEVAFKAIGDLGLKEGSTEKALLDAAVGGIMSKLGGGDFASGAAGAGFTQLVMNELKNTIKDPGTLQLAAAILGAAAAKIAGGDAQTGAGTAVSEIKNNFLSHWQKDERQKAIDAKDWAKVAYWDAIDKAQNQACAELNINFKLIDWEDPQNAKLLQRVSERAQELEADPNFQSSYLNKLPSVDTSTLIAAGVIGTVVVVAGIAVYNYNGVLVKTASVGEIAASAAQYQRLKDNLAQEEIQSVVRTTEHGVTRLLQRGFTPSEISDLKLSPDMIKRQADGANVFIKNIGDGKYNVIVEGENGVVTALKNISEKSLNKLAQNYGWE